MTREIEVKILEINPEEVRKKILGIGAEKVFDGELNTILFDFPDESLLKKDNHLRVRQVGDKVELCFKGKNESAQFKTKEEIEVNTSNFEDTVKIFEKLGFIRVYEGQRKRESYKLNQISFEIDTYPTMPTWLEVEAPTEEEVIESVQKLGFTMDQTTNLGARDLEKMYAEKNK
ncbi:class IV adenylate cyclase [Nanoarchaeota archaeon]